MLFYVSLVAVVVIIIIIVAAVWYFHVGTPHDTKADLPTTSIRYAHDAQPPLFQLPASSFFHNALSTPVVAYHTTTGCGPGHQVPRTPSHLSPVPPIPLFLYGDIVAGSERGGHRACRPRIVQERLSEFSLGGWIFGKIYLYLPSVSWLRQSTAVASVGYVFTVCILA